MKEELKIPQIRFCDFNTEWNHKSFNESIELLTDYHANGAYEKLKDAVVLKDSEDFAIMIRTTNLEKQEYTENLIYVDEKAYNFLSKSKVYANDLIINKIANAGATYLMPDLKRKVSLGMNLFLVRINSANDPRFMFYSIKHKEHKLKALASGTSTKTITKDDVRGFKLYLPKLGEQQKIADFLSSVDKKISLLKEKHSLLTQYKKGVMQKLFKQEIRFKDDNGNDFPDWQIKKLGDCFAHHNDKNGGEDNQLLSVRVNGGVVPRNEIVGKDNSSEDKSKYLKVDTGDIVYNSMRMWQGASGLSKYNGIVSPAYTVITPKENYCAKYFSHFFKFPNTVNLFRRNSQGLTSDTWNLKFPLFSQIKVAVPSKNEQRKISDFLDALDTKLSAVNQQIELTQTFKKGLLQQMFV